MHVLVVVHIKVVLLFYIYNIIYRNLPHSAFFVRNSHPLGLTVKVGLGDPVAGTYVMVAPQK